MHVAIRVGNVTPEPGARELDDADYCEMIEAARQKDSTAPVVGGPAKDER